MNDAVKKHLKRTAILCLIALFIGGIIGWFQANAHLQNRSSNAVAGIQIGGPYELTDQNGKTVTDKSFPGKYQLIFFGFTSCADTCPLGMAKITKALKTLGPAADDIQPIFITVDPERDTPKVLKSYLSMYSPKFVGLTGSEKDIDAVLKNYKIYAAKAHDPSQTDYTVNHSSFTYFINPQGELLTLYRSEDSAEFMAGDIGKTLTASK